MHSPTGMTALHLLFSLISLASSSEVILHPGLSKTIHIEKAAEIRVTRKDTIRIKDNGTHLLITGIKSGHTNIFAGKQEHSIHVLKKHNYETWKNLQIWKTSKLGPKISIKKGLPQVTGTIHVVSDWVSLSRSVGTNGHFSITAQTSISTQKNIQKKVNELTKKYNLPSAEFKPQPKWHLLVATNKGEELKLYRQLFQSYGLSVKHSPYTLSKVPMVEVKILVTEVKKTDMYNIGIAWPTQAKAQLIPKLALASGESLELTVSAQEHQGQVKVLASPTLLTKSGESAEFHVGGELPIRISGQFNANVVWKKYGILLKMTPKADYSGNVSIDLNCEVSVVDDAQSIDGVPGILTNRIASHFNLNGNSTIALSGLIREEWKKGSTGLAGLKNIPLLGQLFSSQGYRNNKTELIFFVTPKVIY